MVVDREWLLRDLGRQYAARLDGGDTRYEATYPAAKLPTLMREVIDFDSDSATASAFAEVVPAAGVTLAHFVDIPWPAGLAPVDSAPPPGESLPAADVLIVTWTVDEAHALSRVLTPSVDSQTGWRPYVKNFALIAKQMRPGCPAKEVQRLGLFWTTQIGGRSVTVFKSDSHMSQDGPKLPNQLVWAQIIADVGPRWVITTGTGGGIGPDCEVGDVLVSPWVSFDCRRNFKELNGRSYHCPTAAPTGRFPQTNSLFQANAGFLPATNTRPPRITTIADADAGVLTTDFFGFDDTTNTYRLQGHGGLSEMGDAVLGMVCAQLPNPPAYTAVRNVSDPQIAAGTLSIAAQATIAADIYKTYGRWSTVCSAITCWAIVADLS